jgi:hypothetical protein
MRPSQAKTYTDRVDSDGHALVRRAPPPGLSRSYDRLVRSGLLTSLVDDAQLDREVSLSMRIWGRPRGTIYKSSGITADCWPTNYSTSIFLRCMTQGLITPHRYHPH